ncbi:MAG TPA: hypothetical protein ENI61_04045 [Ignavibacteria bacterium]|nr:hypothetical protein [Ignavibacteria bacterium]
MFEKLKEKLLERIEKNSIKVNVDGEIIYLKKSKYPTNWHVIYPPVNPETKKWDMLNLVFGGKGNAIKTLLVGVIIVTLSLGVMDIVNSYNATLSNPIVQACLNQGGIQLG